jgi:single-stranded DNA-binding protein
MNGENFVRLRGFLAYPKLSTTTNGFPRFEGKIAVPTTYKDKAGEMKNTKLYYKLSAWGDVAEALGNMLAETPLEIVGHINERSYDGKCKHCGESEKKYWTDVQVDTFSVTMDE